MLLWKMSWVKIHTLKKLKYLFEMPSIVVKYFFVSFSCIFPPCSVVALWSERMLRCARLRVRFLGCRLKFFIGLRFSEHVGHQLLKQSVINGDYTNRSYWKNRLRHRMANRTLSLGTRRCKTGHFFSYYFQISYK